MHGAIRLSDAAGTAKFLLTSWEEDLSFIIATRQLPIICHSSEVQVRSRYKWNDSGHFS